MHVELCICDAIPSVDIETRVVVVMHRREAHKTTNTAYLAKLALSDCEIHLRGLQDQPTDLSSLSDPDRRTLLLFPRDDAELISPELVAADPRPITLAVPDGTWAQARRAVAREPELVAATAVRVPAVPPSRYRLRNRTQPDDLATFEAIARVLGVIEGPAVQRQLEGLFDIMVERTLGTRGHHRHTW